MKYFVILLILIGFSGTAFAYERSYSNYYLNPEIPTSSLTVNNYKYIIPYIISNGTLTNMKMDCESTTLTLNIENTKQGKITLQIPRTLIDSKQSNGNDDIFFVLVNSKEIQFQDFADRKSRTLIIPFSNNSSQIEIIGANYPDSLGINACNGKHDPPYSYLQAPLKQFKSGISIDKIQCIDNLQLILKTSNNSPTCVKPETKTKLLERGWGEHAPIPEPEIIKETDFDSEKYYEEFDSGSPLIYLDTSNPVLDNDNCERYAYWLTKHQKEKLDRYEDYPRYPPWGNQIFPLVDYCIKNGELVKTVTNNSIHWEFKLENEN